MPLCTKKEEEPEYKPESNKDEIHNEHFIKREILRQQVQIEEYRQDINELENNVNMIDRRIQNDRLRERRQAEMRYNRAGGYADYNDDEYEELRRPSRPSRSVREGIHNTFYDYNDKQRKRGYRIKKNSSSEKNDDNTIVSDYSTSTIKGKRTKDAKFRKKDKRKSSKKRKKYHRKMSMEEEVLCYDFIVICIFRTITML